MDNTISQELAGGRSVSVGVLPNERFGVKFVHMNGAARVVTQLGISKEAAESLILLFAFHGVTAPKPPHAISMEIELPERLKKAAERGKPLADFYSQPLCKPVTKGHAALVKQKHALMKRKKK